MSHWAQHLQHLWGRLLKPVAAVAAGSSPGPAPATGVDSAALAAPTILQSQSQHGQPGQWLHLHGQSPQFALWGSTRVGRSHVACGKPCEDSVAASFTAQGALHAALADGVSSGARGDVASQAMVQFAVALPVPCFDGQATHLVTQQTTHHAAQQHLTEQLAQADLHVAQALAAAAHGRSGATTSAAQNRLLLRRGAQAKAGGAGGGGGHGGLPQ